MPLRIFATLLTSVILLGFSIHASAHETVRLSNSSIEHPLHLGSSVLPDLENRWTTDDFPAFKSESQDQVLSGEDFKSVPYEMSRFWLTFDVINDTDQQDWVIFIPMYLVNSIELIAQDPQGNRQYSRSGEDIPPHTRPFNDFGNSLPLTLRPNERYQVAILVQDRYLPMLSINELSLMSSQNYNQTTFRLNVMIVASLATMIVMGLFMLLLWWRIKDPTYGWYGLFSLATFGIWAVNYEFLRSLFPNLTNLYSLNYLAMSAMLYFSAQLSRSYLELHRFSPRIDRFYRRFTFVILAWMCVVAFVPYAVGYLVSAIFALTSLPFLIAALFVTLRAGFRPARLYLLAWALYFSNGTLAALDGLGMNLSTASIRLLTVTSTAAGLFVMAYSVIQRIEELRL